MIERDEAHLFVVGFMGSGKSTVAGQVAARAGRAHVDLDAEIVETRGRTIPQWFAGEGEAAFRDFEQRTLARLVERPPAVVSTGGGAYERAANRRLLRARGVTVWLDVTLEEARRRVGEGRGRPRWQADDPVALRALFERRRALYALADLRVEASRKPPEEVAREVFELFEGFFD